MRTKRLTKLLALVLCIGAFSMPVTAYANSDMTPPTLTATLDGDTLLIEAHDDSSGVEAVYLNETQVSPLVDGKASVSMKEQAENAKKVELYAVDYAGNKSDTVTLDNPFYVEDTGTPFTPDGTGTILDDVTDTEGGKQFYTITTQAGNIFYLIIDGEREENNVYFLNAVTEADLMALAEKDAEGIGTVTAIETCNCTDRCEAGTVNVGCPMCKNDLTKCTGKEKPAEPEEPPITEQPKKDTGSVGTIIFVVIALLAVAVVGYYVKIVRPKQHEADNEDEDLDDDGYGEGFDTDELLDLDKYYLDEEDAPDTGNGE